MSEDQKAYDPELLQALKDSLEAHRSPTDPTDYLRAALAWMQIQPAEHGPFVPSNLQREFRCTYHQACQILEALEKGGELVKLTSGTWSLAPKAAIPTRAGVELHLSPKEHGALLRLLDRQLQAERTPREDRCASCGCTDEEPCLDDAGHTACSWAEKGDAVCSRCKRDLPTLRAIRNRMKRPA